MSKLCFVAGLSMIATTTSTYCRAQTPPISDIIADPKSFIGRPISIRDASCVDPGGVSIICEKRSGRSIVRIEASGLGPKTSIALARKLIGPCKGAANLQRARCRMHLTITPTAAVPAQTMVELGDRRATYLYGALIEMTDGHL